MRNPATANVVTSRGHRAAIHVCSLDRVLKTVDRERPSHLITLLHNDALQPTPAAIARPNHLRLSLHDISIPQLGMVHPGVEHVERILTFVTGWDRAAPMLVHCLAGISRSTATAFIAACALNPGAPEELIAQQIRKLSPTASPNLLLVEIADDLLKRNGEMIRAIEDIGYGEPAMDGWPFALASDWPPA